MKRRDLIKKLNQIASQANRTLSIKREGGNHTIYEINGVPVPVPRHTEISEGLARTIIKQASDAAKEA